MKQITRVLFVCLGNSCRSPMAEALARHLAADVITPSSAGLVPLRYIAAPTQAVLAERGVSIDGQTSKPLPGAGEPVIDLVINLSGRPIKNFFDAGTPPVEDWDVDDPFGDSLAVYRRVRDEIEQRIIELAERLRASNAAAAEKASRLRKAIKKT